MHTQENQQADVCLSGGSYVVAALAVELDFLTVKATDSTGPPECEAVLPYLDDSDQKQIQGDSRAPWSGWGRPETAFMLHVIHKRSSQEVSEQERM